MKIELNEQETEAKVSFDVADLENHPVPRIAQLLVPALGQLLSGSGAHHAEGNPLPRREEDAVILTLRVTIEPKASK